MEIIGKVFYKLKRLLNEKPTLSHNYYNFEITNDFNFEKVFENLGSTNNNIEIPKGTLDKDTT